MKNIGVILLIIFCSLFYQDVSFTADYKDGQYRTAIVGTWVEGGNMPPYGLSTFFSDGRYEAKMYDSILKKKLIVSVQGKWWIKDGKLYNVIDSATPSNFPFKKEPYVDVIVDISSSVLIFIDDNGTKYFKYRLEA